MREVIGFTREPWMNGALGAAIVAALATLLIGLVTRRVARR
ncbi:hypothetical protein ACFSTC_57105 [Nonomuraea ferruginea]